MVFSLSLNIVLLGWRHQEDQPQCRPLLPPPPPPLPGGPHDLSLARRQPHQVRLPDEQYQQRGRPDQHPGALRQVRSTPGGQSGSEGEAAGGDGVQGDEHQHEQGQQADGPSQQTEGLPPETLPAGKCSQAQSMIFLLYRSVTVINVQGSLKRIVRINI